MSLNTKKPLKIQLNGENTDNTSSFTYIGSVATSDGGADKEIVSRLEKALSTLRKYGNQKASVQTLRPNCVKAVYYQISCIEPGFGE